jgi:lipid-A-disaccharide synthase
VSTILISAGEASGDHYGRLLIDALLQSRPGLQFFGLGGDEMRAAGFEPVIEAKDVALVGLLEVVKHLPRIRREFKRLVHAVEEQKPALAVLIDFPDFNLRLARELHARGVPVVYFVSPQLWAWRRGRIAQVKKYVQKMLVIFPFEEDFYREHNVAATYVGHPLAEMPPPSVSREEFAQEHALDPAKQWIALLPGSRKQELERHLPEMLRCAAALGSGYEYIVPLANTISEEWFRSTFHIAPASLHLVHEAGLALVHSRAAIIASGTATVEAAIIGTPFVVAYRVSPLTWLLGRPLVKLKHFAMPNLIAGREILPEFIQGDFAAQRIVPIVRKLIAASPERARTIADLTQVRQQLQPQRAGTSAAERAAAEVLQLLDSNRA